MEAGHAEKEDAIIGLVDIEGGGVLDEQTKMARSIGCYPMSLHRAIGG
jgi:hypothetical protein